VNGWELAVRNREWLNTGLYPYSYVHSGGAGQFDVAVAGLTNDAPMNDRWDLLNTYQAAAYSFYRHGGGMACTQSLDVMIGDVHGPGESYTSSAFLQGPDHQRPATRATAGHHGHRLKSSRSPRATRSSSVHRQEREHLRRCAGEFSNDECGSSASARRTAGRRYDRKRRLRPVRGFAQFYAADVWNDHYEQDCFFKSHTSGR
jgi:hypothetical protein